MNEKIESPDLTIGMPVYNGAATIERALSSLTNQTYRNFNILISDNGSTDDTEAICKRLAAADSRIEYYRQPENLGAVANFHYLLESAQAEYFMWAAADDLWAPGFVQKCIEFLDANQDYVSCQSRVLFTDRGRPSHLAGGTFAIEHESASENVIQFLDNPSDNSRYYGIFRTRPLQACFPRTRFHALDWAVSASTLRYGKHAELDGILMIRDSSDISAYEKGVIADHTFPLYRLFPVLKMTWYLLSRRIAPWSGRSLKALYKLNLYSHFALSPYRSKLLARHFMATGQITTALKRWITRPNADYFPALLDHAIISIWGLAPEHGTPFSVLVGNREVHRSELNGTPLEIRVPLAEHRGSPRLRIELVSDTFISPPDQRILGIPLRSIRLIEVRDSAA